MNTKQSQYNNNNIPSKEMHVQISMTREGNESEALYNVIHPYLLHSVKVIELRDTPVT